MTDPPAAQADSSAAVRLLGLLAEPARLAVVGAVSLGAHTSAEVRAATGLGARAVSAALARLTSGGLLRTGSAGLEVALDVLRDAAAAAALRPETGRDDEDDPVLRAFLRDGRIVTMPASRRKRLALLTHVVAVFDVGRRYPEREVDAMLRAFYDDHAALRRYLVDEELLDRAEGVYWRIGGQLDVDD